MAEEFTTNQTRHILGFPRWRLWRGGAFFGESFIVFLDQTFVFGEELLAERGLHFVAALFGQVAPNSPEHVFDVGCLRLFLRAPLDAIGAVAGRADGCSLADVAGLRRTAAFAALVLAGL